MAIDKITGYYTLRDILGYNAIWNFILSSRGLGKSYSIKNFLVDQPYDFVCLYRDETDMDKAIETWVEPCIMAGHGREEFGWEQVKYARYLYVNGHKKGWFMSLTAVNHIKQMQFPEFEDEEGKHCIGWIFFDEFIPLAWKKLRGVRDESEAIRTIYRTIDHDVTHPRVTRGYPKLRCLMVANPFTFDNPILTGFKVQPKRIGMTKINPELVCEVIDYQPEAKDGFDIDEWLGNEVNRNMNFLKEYTLVAPVPKGSRPEISIRAGTQYFGLYRAPTRKLWVKGVSKHINAAETRIYGSMEGLQENETCLEGTQLMKHLWNATYNSDIHFDNINTKFAWLNALDEYK